VLLSAELDQDNAVNLSAASSASLLGERLGRGQEPLPDDRHRDRAAGRDRDRGDAGQDGGQPDGDCGRRAVRLYHSIDPAYREDPSFGWMMHDNVVLAALRKLKDSQNRYLWEIRPTGRDAGAAAEPAGYGQYGDGVRHHHGSERRFSPGP
jgi:hypothetical protein